MASNYFNYSGTQYAANAAYQQPQQAYGVPGAAAGGSTAASYTPQRTAYDAAYQTSTTPVTYSAPAAVGVTYDSTKTYYQQAAAPVVAAASTATPGQGAVPVGSTSDFQSWQQANYAVRQTNAAAVAAAAANKVAFCTSYNPGPPTTRQLTVPPITPKVQTTNAASAYAASQFTSQPTATTANYNYTNTTSAQTVSKAATVGTIGPPVKKVMPYQSKQGQATISMPPTPNTSNNAGGPYNTNSMHSSNTPLGASAYASVPGTPYSGAGVNNSMYNAVGGAIRPKSNHVVGQNAGNAGTYQNPYDAALFSAAATMYMSQNPRAATAKSNNNFKPRPGLGSNAKFKNYRPPKPQQLHYCDACKISCAGPSAYHDHLQGQKHKKKVAKVKPEQAKKTMSAGGTLPVFICELCDIECTAADAYAAHLRGAKHTKVVKLHTKLGKPIPPPDPKASAALNAQEEPIKIRVNDVVAPSASGSIGTPPVRSLPPRINFVAAGSSASAATSTISRPTVERPEEQSATNNEDRNESELSLIDDRPAVGSEYIEEEKDSSGKLISFNCKLCECKFSDPNAKEMHMKGRKHRLQFKKKVDPKLKVEMKPNNFKHNKRNNEKWKKQAEKKDLKRKDMRFEDEFDYFDWCRKPGGPPPVPGLMPQGIRHPLMRAAPRPLLMGPGGRMPMPPQPSQPMFMVNPPPPTFPRKIETYEDRHILTRNKAIFPTNIELRHIQRTVDHIERALKLVSDQMLTAAIEESEVKKEEEVTADVVEKSEPQENGENGGDDIADTEKDDCKNDYERSRGAARELTGVLRVGIIAKGLILSGDSEIELVMLCNRKPTMTLLSKVVSLLPDQLKEVSDTEFTLTAKPTDAAIVVSTVPKDENDKVLTVTITLTSTVIREEILANPAKEEVDSDVTAAGDGCKVSKEISPDPPDVLSKTKCLEALAALRHAKWFQAKASTFHSCYVIIRILRDVCRRVPAWAPFDSWTLELLCEKVLSSSNVVLTPGDGLRRVFECISSGILLPDGPGLLDPCEKDPVDATACLTPQQREDITTYAQYALRLIAFRQIHKVLGMEPLPPAPKFRGKQTNRKRRRENSAGGGRNEGVDGKKDKKEEEDEQEGEQDVVAGTEENGQEEAAEPEKMDTDVKVAVAK